MLTRVNKHSTSVSTDPSTRLITAVSLAIASICISQSALADGMPKTNSFWWPEQLNLQPLRQNDAKSNPLGEDFNYAEAFKSLNLANVKSDIESLLTSSQDWWPADYGHYGPFFVRMAWHSTGTYRMSDGRGGGAGGQQRFEPLNSWPDNVSLDKARRLLWPIKQKYGRSLSWADLMVLTGNVAMESMGFTIYGFAGGREDDFEPDLVYWGPEKEWLGGNERYSAERKLEEPLAAVQMGLIYVNPEGPNGNHDPLSAAADIRDVFARMAMNDEETVALIAGGHTFGKAHGAHKPNECLDPAPAGAAIEEQGLGWKNNCGKGNAEDTISSGLEGAWSVSPTQWTMQYLDNLFGFEWVKTESPAGATQWIPKDGAGANLVPDAHVKSKRHAPIMFTTDLALKEDPEYRKIAERFHANPKEFELAFSKAWFKLTHRDMGPRARYVGGEAPTDDFLWQDPIPTVDYSLIDKSDIKQLKKKLLDGNITPAQLVKTAWAAAASFRATDMRGGVNGARIQLTPQKDWEVNNPEELNKVLTYFNKVKKDFNDRQSGNKQVSLADLIVLGGAAAIEQAASKNDFEIEVPFIPGRSDATQAQTEVAAFAVLEPKADGFRNYYAQGNTLSPVEMLVDKANTLDLSVPEMSVLVAGLRVINTNVDGSDLGVLTDKPGALSNDFFVNLLDMSTRWRKAEDKNDLYIGYERKTDQQKWRATSVDLIFGSNSELRAVAEVYASDDAHQQFVEDFVKAWTKVMTLDRFDLQ
ncbi:catalase/peroxidase HPI [Paraglaciecola chathamensis]|uniref:Catalase-peroxidase n=2 Tax=Paraglaciecola chathamensis TaxID=368405 RepID=A0A8H9IB17_9ALTE|nr:MULTISPECIES: catalase/peroxidase HPI [Paraglaciecola]AEE23239.1 catalase/peroxidase HPI [Glaciecola sp. 4H-3-7+YE-5]GAC12020.1 catalase-peroxidase 2 [Paraglaciecola chathamensis S18K6]GGZ68813.1 catalase-peroxidase 2 [Paraglaciecola oceanifecundans]